MKLGHFQCCCVLFIQKFSYLEIETKLKGLHNFNWIKYLNCSKLMEHQSIYPKKTWKIESWHASESYWAISGVPPSTDGMKVDYYIVYFSCFFTKN